MLLNLIVVDDFIKLEEYAAVVLRVRKCDKKSNRY